MQFADAAYLASPGFFRAIWKASGPAYRRKGLFWGLVIIVATWFSLLTGPATALLVVPNSYDDWYAGGARFAIVGGDQATWPSTLDATHLGNQSCRHIDPGRDLSQQFLNQSGCAWSGFPSLLEHFQSTSFVHFGNGSSLWPHIPQLDTLVTRNMMINEQWATAPHLASCIYSDVLYALWHVAMFNASTARPGTVSSKAYLRYRQRDAENLRILNSQVPIVRTNCLVNSSVSFVEAISNETHYPVQPLNGSEVTAASILPFNSRNRANLNSTEITARWITSSHGGSADTQGPLTNASSAYLSIQIPRTNRTIGDLVSCSIDARWRQGDILGGRGFLPGPANTYQVDVFPISWTSQPIWKSESRLELTSRRVQLGLDWLQGFTPLMSKTTGVYQSTLSSALAELGLDNRTGQIPDLDISARRIETIVSAFVADGMSRIGLDLNSAFGNSSWDRHTEKPPIPTWMQQWFGTHGSGNYDRDVDDLFNSLLDGVYTLPLLRGPNTTDASYSSYVKWVPTVTGLGYRVGSTAYWLALTMLWVHFAIALAHIIWVLKQPHETSSAWGSLSDLLMLALSSPPPRDPALLENASVSIEKYDKYEAPIRFRTVATSHAAKAGEVGGVHMVFGSAYSLGQHVQIALGEAY